MTDTDDLSDENWHEIAPIAGDVARFIWYVESNECQIDEHLRSLTGLHDLIGRQPADNFVRHIHPADQPYVTMAMRDAVDAHGSYAVEFRFRTADDRTIWLTGNGQARHTKAGEIAIIGVNQDVTALHERHERADFVAHEMNHRIKNILTVVSSVFRASARTSDDKDQLITAFEQRLSALASLNSVMVQSGQATARLADLVNVILKPVDTGRITRSLDEVVLNATASQTLALLLNELMTNALKYGGLASDGHGVELTITSRHDVFSFDWKEHSGHEVTAPVSSRGFGMSVLRGMTSSTFNGNPKLVWEPSGRHFTCEWPSHEMAATP